MCVCSNPNNPSPSKTTTKNDCSFLISNLTQRVAMRRRRITPPGCCLAAVGSDLELGVSRFGADQVDHSVRNIILGENWICSWKHEFFFQYLGNCLMIFHTFDIAVFLHFFNSFRPMKWTYLYELLFQGEVKFKLYFKSGGAIDFGTAMLKAAQMGKKIH